MDAKARDIRNVQKNIRGVVDLESFITFEVARIVVGGLISSTALTLLVLPAVHTLQARRSATDAMS